MNASTATADTPMRQASMRLGGMLAGRLAARGLNVLFQVRLSRKRLRVGVPIAVLHAMGPTPGVLAVSSRTVMNNVGYRPISESGVSVTCRGPRGFEARSLDFDRSPRAGVVTQSGVITTPQ